MNPQQNSENQTTKLPRELVEDCFQISASSLCKSILKPMDIPGMFSENHGKAGLKTLRQNGVVLKLQFDVNLEERRVTLQHWVLKHWLVQEVFLDAVATPFGERGHLTCNGCGRRGSLYLRLDQGHGQWWGCRRCLNLGYEVKRFNKRSAMGFLSYSLNRAGKLMAKEERIKRIDYAGKLTNKAGSLIKLSKKWLSGLGLAD